MGIFSWIFLGLIAGAIAKFIMPGEGPRRDYRYDPHRHRWRDRRRFSGQLRRAREGRVVRPRWNFHRHHRRHHPVDHLSIAEEKIVATIDRLIICTFTVELLLGVPVKSTGL